MVSRRCEEEFIQPKAVALDVWAICDCQLQCSDITHSWISHFQNGYNTSNLPSATANCNVPISPTLESAIFEFSSLNCVNANGSFQNGYNTSNLPSATANCNVPISATLELAIFENIWTFALQAIVHILIGEAFQVTKSTFYQESLVFKYVNVHRYMAWIGSIV